jgi:hypothetical protein
VATREEAAAWEPDDGRWWQRLVAWPTAATIGGAAILVATVIVIALLVFGTVMTRDDNGNAVGSDSDLPAADGEVMLNEDAALITAARLLGPEAVSAEIEVRLTTYGAALEATAAGDASSPEPPDAAAWLVRFRGMFSPSAGGFSGGPFNQLASPSSPTPTCREITVVFLDSDPFYPATTGSPPSGDCTSGDGESIRSREAALLAAAYGPDSPFLVGLTPPLEASATPHPYGEARDMLVASDWPIDFNAESESDASKRTWLVTLKGAFYPPPEQIPPSPPGFSIQRLHCSELVFVIDAQTASSLLSQRRLAGSCYPRPGSLNAAISAATPAVPRETALEYALDASAIRPGQTAEPISTDTIGFKEAVICSCLPPYPIEADLLWAVTLRGMLSEPLDKAVSPTPPPSEARCSEVVVMLDANAGTPLASIYQLAEVCS